MLAIKYSNIFLCGALAVYILVSQIIFDGMYLTSNVVVDEEFHLEIGEAYCNYQFDKWHPKVTTFPGLYLLSSLLFGGFGLCSTYWLRLTSFIFSIVNIILFYCIFSINKDNRPNHNVVAAINLGLLPPLYFFSHLYYTDVASLTMILTLFLLSEQGNHYFASIFGMIAVLFRQNNIVWVGMVFANYVIKEVNGIYYNKPKKATSHGVTFKELTQLVQIANFRQLWITIKKTSLIFWLNALCYCSVLFVFVLFVYLNGSVVVGDKDAHQTTIHLPQIFYFSVFTLFFAWPHFIAQLPNIYRSFKKRKVLLAITVVAFVLIIHFNTQVHPYMLADNRHYVFYIWNRFYGKYLLFRYLMIPVYIFALSVIVKKLWNPLNVTFALLFISCTCVVLTTQKLLEFRYFLIPFVLFRLHLKNTSLHSLAFEFLTFCVINICTLYLFFTKTIQWENFSYPQRLIW